MSEFFNEAICRVARCLARIDTDVIVGDGLVSGTSGYGVIVNEEGNVITCHHIIKNASSIRMTTVKNETYTLNLVSSSSSVDIAILSNQHRQLMPTISFVEFAELPGAYTTESAFVFDAPWPQFTCGSTSGKIGCRTLDSELTLLQFSRNAERGWSGGPIFAKDGAVLGIVTTGLDEQTIGKFFNILHMSNHSYGVASNTIIRYLKKSNVPCNIHCYDVSSSLSTNSKAPLGALINFKPTNIQLTADIMDTFSKTYNNLCYKMSVMVSDLFQVDDDTKFIGFSSIRCAPDCVGVEALALFTLRPFLAKRDAIKLISEKMVQYASNLHQVGDEWSAEDSFASSIRMTFDPATLHVTDGQYWGREWKRLLDQNIESLVGNLDLSNTSILRRLRERKVLSAEEYRDIDVKLMTRELQNKIFIGILRQKLPLDIEIVIKTLDECFNSVAANILRGMKTSTTM